MQQANTTMSPALRHEMKTWLGILAIILSFVAWNVFAGTDATFSTATSTVTNWIEGSMGKLAAIGALAVGVVTAMVTHKLQSAAVAGGIALVASIGPSVINGIFTVAL